MIEGKRILVTGGAGFIGSRLVERLVYANDVVVFDNFARDALSAKVVARHSRLSVLHGDVLDRSSLEGAVRSADVIVHCAAIAGIDTVVQSPVRTITVNTVGTANVLECAAALDHCDRVVCFSTSEVFGQQAFRSAETDRAVLGHVGEARWTYAVSKFAAEHLAIAYHDELGLPTTVIRPFNVYGPGQVGEGALRTFVLRALAGETIEVHGDGTQIRAWCYVDDLIDGVLLAMRRPEAIGRSFNVGNQRAVVTVYGLANTVVRVLDSVSEIKFVPQGSVDVELRIPSVEKARTLLGFEAAVDLEEGIRRTAAYYRGAKWSRSRGRHPRGRYRVCMVSCVRASSSRVSASRNWKRP